MKILGYQYTNSWNSMLFFSNGVRCLYFGINEFPDWTDFLWPLWRNDGDRGFFEFGLFRCGWLPDEREGGQA